MLHSRQASHQLAPNRQFLVSALDSSASVVSIKLAISSARFGAEWKEAQTGHLPLLNTDTDANDGPQGALFQKVLAPCWDKFDQKLITQMGKTTLDDLVKQAESAGLKRPLAEPITFSI